MATLAVRCEFAELALLKARLHELDVIIDSEDFTADGRRPAAAPARSRVDEAQTRITDITRGRSIARRVD